jgi:hypothetical protein
MTDAPAGWKVLKGRYVQITRVPRDKQEFERRQRTKQATLEVA